MFVCDRCRVCADKILFCVDWQKRSTIHTLQLTVSTLYVCVCVCVDFFLLLSVVACVWSCSCVFLCVFICAWGQTEAEPWSHTVVVCYSCRIIYRLLLLALFFLMLWFIFDNHFGISTTLIHVCRRPECSLTSWLQQLKPSLSIQDVFMYSSPRFGSSQNTSPLEPDQ